MRNTNEELVDEDEFGADRRSADALRGSCCQCGMERLIAYWDSELEHYIYLVDINDVADRFLCANCEMREVGMPETLVMAIA